MVLKQCQFHLDGKLCSRYPREALKAACLILDRQDCLDVCERGDRNETQQDCFHADNRLPQQPSLAGTAALPSSK